MPIPFYFEKSIGIFFIATLQQCNADNNNVFTTS